MSTVERIAGKHFNDIAKIAGINSSNINKIMGIQFTGTGGGGEEGGGDFYSKTIGQSCRFNDDDSPYLSRSFNLASSGGTKKTISCWIKRGNLTADCVHTYPVIWAFRTDSNQFSKLRFYGSDKLTVAWWDGSSCNDTSTYSPYLRDTSAWYNIVVAIDTTQATSTDRIKLYINGVQYATSGACPTQDSTINIMENGVTGAISKDIENNGRYFDGYIAEVVAVDGQALEATDFGQFQNGIWTPKEYAGTYGNNGFHLDFADDSDLGNDVSGNNNDFTSSGLTSTDQVTDTPTNNYCTLNPICSQYSGVMTISEGNLKYAIATPGDSYGVLATYAVNSGKWYWEVTTGTLGSFCYAGVHNVEGDTGRFASGYRQALSGSTKYGFKLDCDANPPTLQYTTNGVDWNNPGDGSQPSAGDWLTPVIQGFNCDAMINFGQDGTNVVSGNTDDNGYGDFEYAPPTGFLALCSANLSDPAWMTNPTTDSPSDAFDIVLRTGTGAEATVSSLGFDPDLVVVKGRNVAYSWCVTDSVRGATKRIHFDVTAVEATDSQGVKSFDTGGYTLGTDNAYNQSTKTFADFCWLKGADYGFDIVEYTGTGAARTVAHSLGVVPSVIMVKSTTRDNSWVVYHEGVSSDPETDFLEINSAGAAQDADSIWNDTAPTSTVFTVGTAAAVNFSAAEYIAYLWAEIPGFSKFGYYTGNGNADGPLVYCGFRPKMVLFKNVAESSEWFIIDTVRDVYNTSGSFLEIQNNNAENGAGSYSNIDFLSSGFKVRNNYRAMNGSAKTIIYMAFAETPFKYANAR